MKSTVAPDAAMGDESLTNKPRKSAQPKRKKRAPDRPQPEWLFPADEDNPVLNPKPVSEEKARKDKEDWDGAVRFLQRKAVTAPMKDPPPGMLLTLVGAFLTTYGFHPASRLFTTHVAARARLDDWKTELGVKLPRGFPDLVKIFNDWHVDWEATRSLKEDSEEEKPKGSKKPKTTADVSKNEESDTSSDEESTSSSEESDSGVSMNDAPKSRTKQLKRKPTSDESSTSDSDSASSVSSSSDKAEPPTKKPKVSTNTASKVQSSKTEFSKSAKAKPTPKESYASETSSSSESSSTESSDSESNSDDKAANIPAKPKKSEVKVATKKGSAAITNIAITGDNSKSTDSSTLEGSPVKEIVNATSSSSSISYSSSDSPSSASTPPVQEKAMKKSDKKRKRSKSPAEPKISAHAPAKVAKTQNVPFKRISKDTLVDPKLASNAYVPYDYADRAHKDLSVAKGKGFTKEKNKKKRGSYRGGQIDVEGKKAIKFDD